TVTAAGFRTFSPDQENTDKAPTSIDLEVEDVELADHQHYMHKEIFEQPYSVERMLRGRLDDRFGTARLDGLNLGPRELRSFRRVKILGCGSAYYVGQIGAAMIEDLGRGVKRKGGQILRPGNVVGSTISRDRGGGILPPCRARGRGRLDQGTHPH